MNTNDMKKHLRILIGDHDDVRAHLMITMIESMMSHDHSLDILVTKSSYDFLRLGRTQDIDLFIVTVDNLVLPGEVIPTRRRMYHTIQFVRYLKHRFSIPIMAFSVSTGDWLAPSVHEAGASSYLEWPVVPEDLKQAILSCLEPADHEANWS